MSENLSPDDSQFDAPSTSGLSDSIHDASQSLESDNHSGRASTGASGAQESSPEESGSFSEGDAPTEQTDANSVEAELELLKDLQRLQAEFVNYKARVERDRDVARNAAIAEVLRALLPALDDLTRAENHGDLEGSPFAAVVSKIRNAGDKFGLKQFGAKGDKFDPEQHNALVQTPNPEVTENVIADVVEPGYLLGDRLLRPAMVAVFIPAE
jgi:molecular chaperone GrpE